MADLELRVDPGGGGGFLSGLCIPVDGSLGDKLFLRLSLYKRNNKTEDYEITLHLAVSLKK